MFPLLAGCEFGLSGWVVYLYVWWFVGARFWLFLWIELPIFALIVLDNAMV